MKVLAFLGCHIAEQAKLIAKMSQQITPDYRVKSFRINAPGLVGAGRIVALRHWLAAGVPPDTVLCVLGVSNIHEFKILHRRGAMFGILPGSLPSLLTQNEIKIDERFIFVAGNPDQLETEAKRSQFNDPASAFSLVLVNELNRSRSPREAIQCA